MYTFEGHLLEATRTKQLGIVDYVDPRMAPSEWENHFGSRFVWLDDMILQRGCDSSSSLWSHRWQASKGILTGHSGSDFLGKNIMNSLTSFMIGMKVLRHGTFWLQVHKLSQEASHIPEKKSSHNSVKGPFQWRVSWDVAFKATGLRWDSHCAKVRNEVRLDLCWGIWRLLLLQPFRLVSRRLSNRSKH